MLLYEVTERRRSGKRTDIGTLRRARRYGQSPEHDERNYVIGPEQYRKRAEQQHDDRDHQEDLRRAGYVFVRVLRFPAVRFAGTGIALDTQKPRSIAPGFVVWKSLKQLRIFCLRICNMIDKDIKVDNLVNDDKAAGNDHPISLIVQPIIRKS